MTLQDALAPLSLDEFLNKYVGRQHALIRGTHGRFHGLLSWDDLDRALEQVRVNDDRVDLVRHAKRVARDSYVESSRTGRTQYLNGPAVVKHVTRGATLILKEVDEIIPAIRTLSESCEHVFQFYVSVNLYAAWRRDNGFDVHWDSHGTLILQLRGRKDWIVWGPTRQYPLPGDRTSAIPPPTETPVWQGTLEDGDLLYMPRGWWHVARPRDEPSIHITLALNHPTGMDMMLWLLERMRDSIHVRMDVPVWQHADVQAEWFHSIREACITAFDHRVIEQFLESVAGRAHSRPLVRLPRQSVLAASQFIDETMNFRLTRGSKLCFHAMDGNGMMSFLVRGSAWECHEGLVPALRLLNHITPCTLSEMRNVTTPRTLPLLRPFLMRLIAADVVWIEPSHRTAVAL
jgi:ribosomal protein L16 Arg81 hydroxylase